MGDADVETRKWLNIISKIHVGDCVEFTYQGRTVTGKVDAEIIAKTQYKIIHPAGGSYSVWREYIHKKIPRVKWLGLSENLFQLAKNESKKVALAKCEALLLSLGMILDTGNQDQKGHAAQLYRAAHYAVEQILEHIDG